MKKVQEATADLGRREKDKTGNSGSYGAAAVLGIVLSILIFVVVFFEIPAWISVFFRGVFGYCAYVLPFFIFTESILFLRRAGNFQQKALGLLLLFTAFFTFIAAAYTPAKPISWYDAGIVLNGAGYLGELFGAVLSFGLGAFVLKVTSLLLGLGGLLLIGNFFSFRNLSFRKIRRQNSSVNDDDTPKTKAGKSGNSRKSGPISLSENSVAPKTSQPLKKTKNILSRLSDYNEFGKNKLRRKMLINERTESDSHDFDFGGFETEKHGEPLHKRNPGIPQQKSIEQPKSFEQSFRKVPSLSAFTSVSSASVSASPSPAASPSQAFPKASASSPASAPSPASTPSSARASSSENPFSPSAGIAEAAANAAPNRYPSSVTQSVTSNAAPSSGTNTASRAEQHGKTDAASASASAPNSKTNAERNTAPEEAISGGKQAVPPRKKAGYRIPSSELLDVPSRSKADNRAFIENVIQKLHNVFASFGVDAKVVSYEEGPTITMFEVVLGVGVKIAKLQNLSEDIALNLAAPTVRISPIEGKSTIGIEVPNDEISSVSMREIIDDKEFIAKHSPLNVVLGKDISGKPVVANLATMPHLLVAGATGSGKSVCVNAMILSILLNASPDEVRFVMIDPKQVELSNYNDLPHLIMPVVTDAKQAAAALNWTVREMERRYTLMLELRVKDYQSYNAKCEESEKLPYIVVIVDELADLMMVAAKQVEEAICRIAQKARAAGIHLVLATQRPSVDVITGLIKANIPSRIAFSVSSQIDSRTILDAAGAEKLLGKGDMLYHPVSLSRAKRVQGAFVSSREIDRVVAQIQKQGYRTEQISPEDLQKSDHGGESAGEGDEYLEEAIRLVRENRKASASMLQRKFSIGYNRAARLIDLMEEMGVIGPQQGSKPREVF